MIKKHRSKEMTGNEETVGNKETPRTDAPSRASAGEKRLRCLRECHMPGVGAFKGGEVITDADKINRIADNPNFEVLPEEEKS